MVVAVVRLSSRHVLRTGLRIRAITYCPLQLNRLREGAPLISGKTKGRRSESGKMDSTEQFRRPCRHTDTAC